MDEALDPTGQAGADPADDDMLSLDALEAAFGRMGLIHSEFERRKRLGLPLPSLQEIDRLVGRPPKAAEAE